MHVPSSGLVGVPDNDYALIRASKTFSPNSRPSGATLQGGQQNTERRAQSSSDRILPAGGCRLGLIKLVSAATHENVGDQSQGNAVAMALEHVLISKAGLSAHNISHEKVVLTGSDTTTKSEQLREALAKCKAHLSNGDYLKIIFILSGSDHALASAFGDFPLPAGMTTVSTSHKYTGDMKDAAQLATITALPLSEPLTEDERASLNQKTLLVQVSGVPHDLTNAKLAAQAATYQVKEYPAIPPVDRNTITIIMPGDVVRSDGVILGFSEEDAKALAKNIINKEQQQHPDRNISDLKINVLDCPRTGVYMSYGPEGKPHPVNPHRTNDLNTVTQAMVATLTELGAKVHTFPFHYNKLPSAYASLVKAHKEAAESGGVYVSGDSASMVSEIGSHLRGDMTIVMSKSMDEPNRRHVSTLVAEGDIPWLDEKGVLYLAEKPAIKAPVVPAAEAIAQATVNHIFQLPTRR